jgi:phosphoglycerol transferase
MNRKIILFLSFIVMTLAVFFLFLYTWLENTFSQNITPEQVIYHLFGGAAAVAGSDVTVVSSFLYSLVFMPIVMVTWAYLLIQFNSNAVDEKRSKLKLQVLVWVICLPPGLVFLYGLLQAWFKQHISAEWNPLDFGIYLLTHKFSHLNSILQDQIRSAAIPYLALLLTLILLVFLLGYLSTKIPKHIFELIRNFFHQPIKNLVLSSSLLFLAIISFAHQSQFDRYASNYLWGNDLFSSAYIAPDPKNIIQPKAPKNLLLIYVESLEQGLRNPQVYGENLVKDIDDLPGFIIPNFSSGPGTNWTMAGMVASQCGIPLRPTYHNTLLAMGTAVLPSAICLGDILHKLHYTQYYLVGPDLKFGGMDIFYRAHGYDFAYGRDELKLLGGNLKLDNGWGDGPHDDTLLNQAQVFFETAMKTQQPIAFTILTTDNHAPNGIPSPRCNLQQSQNQLAGTYKCNAKFIANFIKSLAAKGLLKNTVVVIMGDHPFQVNRETKLPFAEPRNVYFKILEPENRLPTRPSMTHYDVAPTILDALNITINPNAQYGLGHSLFSNIDSAQYRMLLQKTNDPNLLGSSPVYDSFWLPRSKPY